MNGDPACCLGEKNQKNIVLIGMPGTGKSSVAEYIGRRTIRRVYDTDTMIADLTGMSILSIFEQRGESFFRNIESEVINQVSKKMCSVIACGGGVVLQPINIERIKKNGLLFCLWAETLEISHRLKNDSSRPLLRGHSLSQLNDLLAEREALYQMADHHINTQGMKISEVGDLIIERFMHDDTETELR